MKARNFYITSVALILFVSYSNCSIIHSILLDERHLQGTVSDSCDLLKNRCEASHCCAQKTSVSQGQTFTNKLCMQPEFHNQTIKSVDGLTNHTFMCLDPESQPALVNLDLYQHSCKTAKDCEFPCSEKCVTISIMLTTNFS